MASEMMEALSQLAREKHIDELHLLTCLEESLAETYTDLFDLEFGARVTIDRVTGHIYVYELVPVGEPDEETGEYAEFEEKDITPEGTSRIAAQNAKMVINRLVRDAGREQIYHEFADRVGDLITGTVLQTTPDFTIVKIREGVEAELPHYDIKKHPEEYNERPQNERYTHGQRIKALIVGVRDPRVQNREGASAADRSRPPIIISRTHPELINRLFEIEVPEVYDGVVEVKNVTREPGVRSKVSVHSTDSRLDPIGACVGPKGSRVRMVVSELRGERVDIIQWSEDPGAYVANALSPARVTNVLVDRENQYATVIVPDDQLSLAIGKEGQNARLAARLTGWHIDIKNLSLASEVLQAGSLLLDEQPEQDEDERCEYVSEDGIRCRNHKRDDSHFCGIHDGADLASNEARAQAAGEAAQEASADLAQDDAAIDEAFSMAMTAFEDAVALNDDEDSLV